ncbi:MULTISPECIES: hypothetical protein [Spirulina sp. CCY15215]|uniref:hypothetical protein n=1 Tax=Spirulina sp. CCY15215 TaxID=2767591 RepID=UPI00195222C3|nr:hypothetical protein [Spirulina major]
MKKINEKESMQEQIQEILEALTEEEYVFLKKVIEAERKLLYRSKPLGINDNIRKAIEEIVK